MDGLCIEGLSCVDDVCQTAVAEESGSASETTTPETTDSVGTTESVVTMSESSEVESTSDGPCTAPEIECNGGCVNPLTDDLNCGECGHTCIVGGGAGGCVDGICSPRLSECVEWSNPMPCNEVCAQLGAACAEYGCPFGSTYVQYDILSDCLDHNPNGYNGDPCTEPDVPSNGAYRCCCSQ